MIPKLKKPCAKCPFRMDVHPYITRGRAEQIAESLQSGGMFPCHETIDYEQDPPCQKNAAFCAGALATMMNEGTECENQMVRIHDRLGLLADPDEIETDMTCDSLGEWVERFDDR